MSPPSPPISPFPEEDDLNSTLRSIAECNRVVINKLPRVDFERLVCEAREQLPPGASDSLLLAEVQEMLGGQCTRYRDRTDLALEQLSCQYIS